MIHAQNVDGSALDPEPSMKSTFSVDGSTTGIRTFRDTCLQRGRFALWYLNLPRYRPPPWMVQPLVSEPSAIQTLSMDGSALDPAPSMKLTFSVDGSTPGIRTIRDIDLQHGRFNPWYPNHS